MGNAHHIKPHNWWCLFNTHTNVINSRPIRWLWLERIPQNVFSERSLEPIESKLRKSNPNPNPNANPKSKVGLGLDFRRFD